MYLYIYKIIFIIRSEDIQTDFEMLVLRTNCFESIALIFLFGFHSTEFNIAGHSNH